ncbi:HincII family type II restriction endonuclease [Actinobacillus pleuropneumoniae]|uniref:HincII family type II restriction endonuclease n=1 Tax=Actinobacillus pleuropneumoniae TaxID=715 RepID=UPI002EA4017F|nr:HincII family type II restriction endonuclease [Actinobacillus pleuropneumoniae]
MSFFKNIYNEINNELVGKTVPKPTSGTLSGHAAGEPFEKLVYAFLKRKLPDYTYKQYEYLNELYKKNPTVIGHKARMALFNSPTLLFLLSRGKEATNKWSIENPFEEKQNDTADILLVKDSFYELLDVKTRNISKSAQSPNIISAYKLAQTCAQMIDNEEYDLFDINYLEIDWVLKNNELICQSTYFAELFKSMPSDLYINWAAAMQIQFDVRDLEQKFVGRREEWARAYLKHFVQEAKKRADDMITRFVKPFEGYIIND